MSLWLAVLPAAVLHERSSTHVDAICDHLSHRPGYELTDGNKA